MLAVTTAGCAAPYYWQAISGQLELLRKREPIEEVIADPASGSLPKDHVDAHRDDAPIRSRRARLAEQRQLHDRTSLSIGRTSSGTSSRRKSSPWTRSAGAFRSRAASRIAATSTRRRRIVSRPKLADDGLDVHSGGSTAYSTLGYFDDPVLSTMVNGGEQYVASLLFHELAHQKLYVRMTASSAKRSRWSSRSSARSAGWRSTGRPRISSAIACGASGGSSSATSSLRSRSGYAPSYASGAAPAAAAGGEGSGLSRRCVREYEALKANWLGNTDYDAWFAQPLNNATLASVATYTRWLPALRARLEEVG